MSLDPERSPRRYGEKDHEQDKLHFEAC
jgi:bacteriocin-like protein